MLRVAFFVLLIVLSAAGSAKAADACAYAGTNADALPATLKRGVNLSRWWEEDRNQAMEPADVKKLHELGFDFVRLPLSPSWLMRSDENEQKETLMQLRCNIISLLDANLAVIVDLHAPERFQRNLAQDSEDAAAARLEKLWNTLQPVLDGLPPGRVLIGLYNEPHIEADSWWNIQGKIVKDLRTVYPDNPFVVTAGPDSGPWDLERMQPYDDANIIYDFHFYQPMQFTHHGADWLQSYRPGDKSARIAYPVEAGARDGDESNRNAKDYMEAGWNRQRLASYIDKVADWAAQNKIKVACLEFGVYRPYVDEQSRARWLRDMRELLESHQIPWALWEYRGGFGLVDGSGSIDSAAAKALDLKHGLLP